MAADPEWWTTVYIIGGTIGSMVAGIATGRKVGRKPAEQDAQVLAASIVPHADMKQLTAAMGALLPVLIDLASLLKAEVHRRELEAEVRQALKDRGITGT